VSPKRSQYIGFLILKVHFRRSEGGGTEIGIELPALCKVGLSYIMKALFVP
jgi:hypothetical protein